MIAMLRWVLLDLSILLWHSLIIGLDFQSFFLLLNNSLISTTLAVWLWVIKILVTNNQDVDGRNISMDGTWGYPEYASIWIMWHILVWCCKYLLIILYQQQSCRKYFPFWQPGKRGKIVCEMKVLFTIAFIQYTIGLQLYLSKSTLIR